MDRSAARRAGNCAKQVRAGRGMALQGLRRQDADQVLYSWSGRVRLSHVLLGNFTDVT